MNTRTRHCLVVIAVQAVCVSVGLLMLHGALTAEVKLTAHQHAWSEMQAQADAYFAELEQGTTFSSDPLGKAGELPMVIVDAHWTVVEQADSGRPSAVSSGTAPYVAGERLVWNPAASIPDDRPDSQWGMILLPDGSHFAVARPWKDGRRLVVHQSQAAVEAPPLEFLTSMPAIGGLTLLWTCIVSGFAVYMLLSRFHDAVDRERTTSSTEVLRQIQELVRTRDAVIFGLAKLADSRDPETGSHLERISSYSTALATALRRHPKFRDQVTPNFVRLIGISSALHDIGKVGVEDSILRKPEPLTPEETADMQKHSLIGGECLREIENRLGASNFLQMAREIALGHHERWDGAGYPHRLAGASIPLAARIVAIADVYDALSRKRVYKGALLHEECVSIISNESGKQFDPDLIAIWLTIEPTFAQIARRYLDCESESAAGGQPPPPRKPVSRDVDATVPCPEEVLA